MHFDWTEIFKWAVVWIFLLVGIFNTIIPILPGAAIILLGIIFYLAFFGIAKISLGWIIFFVALVAFSFVSDILMGIAGAKYAKATKYGVIGSIAGSFLGVVFGGLPGLIVGTFLGAFALEYFFNNDLQQSLRSGMGALLGFFAGRIVQFIIGIIMIGVFLFLIF
jgi:uncharacterized protein YqgC (DUF456 family)